jgi:hypothetical protein
MANIRRSTYHVPLVRAALGLPDDALSCATCRAWLPAYVNAEVEGLSGQTRYRPVKRHLLLCPGCAELYLKLLELALAEERGLLPRPGYYPEPDLSFLS